METPAFSQFAASIRSRHPFLDVQAAVYQSATVFVDGDCFYRLSEENMGIVIKTETNCS